MLFSAKLNEGIYTPWKSQYLAYDHLKRLLKEPQSGEYEWSEQDESRFVSELDKELDKVYNFETEKYKAISERLSAIETKTEQSKELVSNLKPRDLEAELEEVLEDATQLDRFRRLNYTGFSKLVKKHDRLHQKYQVRPLLRARLNGLPFHSEDYSPLLRRLSHIYRFLDENFGEHNGVSSTARSQKHAFGSLNEHHSRGYVTLQFWVHPDNLMEVKTRILRRLPVLVYNREDDDEEYGSDPTVTSLYLDNSHFELYESQLEKRGSTSPGAPTSLRFRWHGHLYEKPEIVLEQHNEEDGHITRMTIKEKTINSFLAGDKSVITKQVAKMRERRKSSQAAIDDFETAATELQQFITEHKLEPMLRTVYKRSAFEIPGDDRVRVILDQDILFIREDSLNKQTPIRDPSSWRRPDLDQPNVSLLPLLRKGEFARFPYSVLEVRLKADGSKIEKLPWIEELQSLKLIAEVPHFTKFLQGIAVLYGEDERLDGLPFWLNDLDDMAKEAPGTAAGSGAADLGEGGSTRSRPQPGPSNKPSNRIADYKFDEDDVDDAFESEDSGLIDVDTDNEEQGPSSAHEPGSEIGLPTWINNAKLNNQDSEDEEVVLPPGVVEPRVWLKNQGAVKVETKVWLANERTFNKWLHVTCLLSGLTFALYNSVSRASSPRTATFVAFILFGLTLFSGVWGYTQYLHRMKLIRERGDSPLDAPLGPIVVAIGLLFALVINFASEYKERSQIKA